MKTEVALMAKGLNVMRGHSQVLCNVDVSIRAGQWTCVVGLNGAGKTTLLKALAGLLPSTGELLVQGLHLRNLPI